MISLLNRAFRFLLIGAFIFIVAYYSMGKTDQILINLGLMALGSAFLSKIVELNLIKRKTK
jgi:hypothetical protein